MTSHDTDADPLLLPAGTRLVHIGPHKTGTTAIQSAMHRSRDVLLAQGVHYAHPLESQAYLPALSLIGHQGRRGGPTANGDREWMGMVEEVEAAGDKRVVISSESFANAHPEHIRRLADDLGPDKVQILRMVRRYDKLLPSQWQQRIIGTGMRPFKAYQKVVLADPEHLFWRRHGFERHTRLWTDVLGPERVTVVVVDESDRGWLLRVMERLTGLQEGTLQPGQQTANQSLTLADAELIRHLNRIATAGGWPDRIYHDYFRTGISRPLKTVPDAHAERIVTSPDLYDELLEVTLRDIEGLKGLGVRIIGDLDNLIPPRPDPDVVVMDETKVTISVAAGAAAVDGSVRRAERLPEASPGSVPPQATMPRLPAFRPVRLLVADGPAGDAFRGAFPERSAGADEAVHAVRRRPWRGLVALVLPPWQELVAGWQRACLAGDERGFAAWCEDEHLSVAVSDRLTRLIDTVGPRRVTLVLGSAMTPEPTVRDLAHLLKADAPGDVPREVLGGVEVSLLESCAAAVRRIDPGAVQSVLRDALVPALLGSPEARPLIAPDLDPAAAQIVREEGARLLRLTERPGLTVIGDRKPLQRSASMRAAQEPKRLRPAHLAAGVAGVISRLEGLDSADPQPR